MNIKRYERNTSGRDYIVGDIHGYFGHLQHELDQMKTLGNTIFIDTGVHLGRKCTIIDAETLQQVN